MKTKRNIFISFKWKILMPIVLSIFLLGLIFSIGIIKVFNYTNLIEEECNNNILKETIKERIDENVSLVYASIDTVAERALEAASFFTIIPVVQEAYAVALSGDITNENSPESQKARDMLRADIKPFMDGYKMQTGRNLFKLHFHLPNTRSLARLWREGYQTKRDGKKVDISDDLTSFRNTILQINTGEHQPIKGIEVGRGGFAIRGLAPVMDSNGRHLGSNEVLFSFREIFSILKNSDLVEYAVYMDEAQLGIATSLTDPEKYPVFENSYVLTDATGKDITENLVTLELLDAGRENLFSKRSGNFMISTFPIRDFSGRTVGVMLQSMDISLQLKSFADNKIILESLRNKISLGTEIAFILAIVMMIIIMIPVIQRIIKPLHSFQVLFQQCTEGDLTVRSSDSSRDEIGHLSLMFNSFMENVGGTVGKIITAADTMDSVKNLLVVTSDQTSTSINSIKENSSSMLQESEKLNINVADNVSAIEQISANILNINRQIEEQAGMVDESTASITEMISSLENVNSVTIKKKESISNLAEVVGDGSETLNEMVLFFNTAVVNKIAGISEMADTIQQISSQTNLLSMNAAIEAAHAGESGKGFAVVADEIRKLAEISAENSNRINSIIKEISEGVIRTEGMTSKTSEAFETINREINGVKMAFDEIASSTDELNAGGKQILNAVTMLREVTINVKDASGEMTTGVEQVAHSQVALKDISSIVSKGIQEISCGSEEIDVASGEIVKYSSELDSIVVSLKEEINKFSA